MGKHKDMFHLIILLLVFFFHYPVFSNEVYPLLSSYSNEERIALFSKLLKLSNNECGNVVSTYFQGLHLTRTFWSVRCSNGNEWSLRFPDKLDDQIEIRSCGYYGQKGLSCFEKISENNNGNQMHEESCMGKKHITSTSIKLIDRCNIISISKNSFFIDDTESHIEEIQNYHHGWDEGIILLLYVRGETGSPYCSFRQLRYFPNEAGFRYSARDMANDLMHGKIRVMSKSHTLDLLQRGKQAPIYISPPPDQHKVITNEISKLSGFEAWETVYEMWNDKEPSSFSAGYKYFTKVIEMPDSYKTGNAKYFITAECGYANSRINISNRDEIIDELIQSLKVL